MKTKFADGKSVVFKNDFLDYISGQLLSPIETQNYLLLQSADSYFLNDFICKEHTQYCDLELTFVVYGSLLSYTNGDFEKVEKGEVYLSFRGEKHIVTSKDGARFQTLAIDLKNESCCAELFSLLTKKFKNASSKKIRANISTQLATILSEFIDDDLPFKTIHLDALISEILVVLTRDESKKSDKIFDTKDLLPDLINYIDTHYLSITTLNELSDEFGYSYGYLCKLFKTLYGVTLSDYLINKRMAYAKNALMLGSSVNEVAESLRYTSPFNFTRAFKKEFGVPPSSFIKK